jgi:hypothetical protein
LNDIDGRDATSTHVLATGVPYRQPRVINTEMQGDTATPFAHCITDAIYRNRTSITQENKHLFRDRGPVIDSAFQFPKDRSRSLTRSSH